MRKYLFLLVPILFSACVSNSTFKKTADKLDQTTEELKAEKTSNQKLSQERADLKTQLASTEEKLIAATNDRGQLKASLDDIKKSMEELRLRQGEQKKRLAEFQDLTRRFKILTDAGTLSVKIIDGKMVVSLGSDVLFPSGSAKLSNAGTDAIVEVTKQLSSIPQKRYQVEGHTDNVPITSSNFPSNWELASARAVAVVKTMVDNGIPTAHLSAASFGEYQPVKTNDTIEGRAANRRIAIVVVPDLSTMPGYDELQKYSEDPAPPKM